MNPVNHLSRNGANLAISRLTPTLNAGASDLRLIIGKGRQPYATGISHTRGQAFCLSRLFSVSSIQKNYHFDTHRYVQRLEKEGLTRAQAEGVMNSMAEVIDESIKTMTKNMVTKSEHEKARIYEILGHRSIRSV
ncbi:hypothetical protein FRC14_006167 [Serendipita sp. 396]|nr:hypothetical protein FRC14_006167 [Serendipita sp. 396]KAG8866596.1 hypothetical protein FRC20_008043 [Serendipita sp. 405]